MEKANYLSKETTESLRKKGRDEIIDYFLMLGETPRNGPKLTMDLEVYSFNEFEEDAYYPPVYYKYDLYRLMWIPRITSEKPIWEYDLKPSWTK